MHISERAHWIVECKLIISVIRRCVKGIGHCKVTNGQLEWFWGLSDDSFGVVQTCHWGCSTYCDIKFTSPSRQLVVDNICPWKIRSVCIDARANHIFNFETKWSAKLVQNVVCIEQTISGPLSVREEKCTLVRTSTTGSRLVAQVCFHLYAIDECCAMSVRCLHFDVDHLRVSSIDSVIKVEIDSISRWVICSVGCIGWVVVGFDDR